MTQRIPVLACAAAIAGLAVPVPASACGGCFAPTGSPTVVTRHQMAISMTLHETTLWDQIEYAGDPEDFVWVLPVRDGAPVQLAENAFFEALEYATAITLQAPLPPRTFCPDVCARFADGGFAFSDASAPDAGVTVHHQAAIGPYETVTIGSDDPAALVAWLRGNGYAVPDAILPTIAHYTDQRMDFAVLRLSPNFGVTQMQPVRVTMPGLGPTFPLRMVAAGVEGSVGLELFVFGEGRYGPMNFASAEVDRDAITYDWATGQFDYDARYAAAQETDGGRVWITEYARQAPSWQIAGYVSYDERGEPHAAAGDWEVVTRHLPEPYLTRITADLTVAHLGEDLILGAVDGGDLDNFIRVTRELNRAPDRACPTECATPPPGFDAGVDAGSGFAGGGGLCAVRAGGSAPALGALILAAAALARRRRR